MGMPKLLTGVEGPVFSAKHWVEAAEKFPVVTEDDMLRKSIDESSEPVVGRLGLYE